MNPERVLETRQAVIRRHVEMAVRHSGLSMETFAPDVVDLYHSRTAPLSRGVRFTTDGDPYRAMHANAQVIARLLGMRESHLRLPADLEEAIVLALPEPYRTECLRELCGRYGLLAAKALPSEPSAALRGPAELMRECAESLLALEPVLADPVVTEEDRPQIERARSELSDVQGVVVSLLDRLARLLPPPHDGAARLVDVAGRR